MVTGIRRDRGGPVVDVVKVEQNGAPSPENPACMALAPASGVKAVILAAGCATRLRPYSDDTPKTLLPVGGVPILRRTITSLLRVGFDQFVIGTGYLEHMVRDAVASWFPGLDVTFVTNPDFRIDEQRVLAAAHARARRGRRLHPARRRRRVRPRRDRGAGRARPRLPRGPLGRRDRPRGGQGHRRQRGPRARDRQARAGALGDGRVGRHRAVLGRRRRSGCSPRSTSASASRASSTSTTRPRSSRSSTRASTLYGVDIGSMYATEIDTIEDLLAANERLAQRPAFDVRVDGLRLAV